MEPVLQLCHPLFIDLSGRTRLQVAARFLAGNPMSAAECGHFCLTEQINALRRNFGVRFTEMFCSPYYPPEERSCDAPAQTLCARIEFFSEKKHFFHLFGFAFFKKHSILDNMFLTSLSSRGLGHRVFIPATRVRIPMGMPFLFFPSNILARMRLFSRYGITWGHIWGHIWGHKCPEEGTHSDGHVYNDETRGAVFSDASAQSTG